MSNDAARGRRDGRRSLHRALRRAEEHVHGRPPLSARRSLAPTNVARHRPRGRSVSSSTFRRSSLARSSRLPTRPRPARAHRHTSIAPTGRSSPSTRRAQHRPRPGVRHRSTVGDDLLLHYAIADVAWFVDDGDPLDQRGVEARYHAVPARRQGRPVPAGARRGRGQPAARRAPAGRRVPRARRRRRPVDARRRRARRHPQPGQAGLRHRSRRRTARRLRRVRPPNRAGRGCPRRGAGRAARAGGARDRSTAAYRLVVPAAAASEDDNAAMSLATNLAVADALHAAGTGLFRVMPEPDERAEQRLRHTARAFGIEWPGDDVAAPASRDRSTASDPKPCSVHAGHAPRRRRCVYVPFAAASCRGTRRWLPRTRTRRRRCVGWPIATW